MILHTVFYQVIFSTILSCRLST